MPPLGQLPDAGRSLGVGQVGAPADQHPAAAIEQGGADVGAVRKLGVGVLAHGGPRGNGGGAGTGAAMDGGAGAGAAVEAVAGAGGGAAMAVGAGGMAGATADAAGGGSALTGTSAMPRAARCRLQARRRSITTGRSGPATPSALPCSRRQLLQARQPGLDVGGVGLLVEGEVGATHAQARAAGGIGRRRRQAAGVEVEQAAPRQRRVDHGERAGGGEAVAAQAAQRVGDADIALAARQRPLQRAPVHLEVVGGAERLRALVVERAAGRLHRQRQPGLVAGAAGRLQEVGRAGEVEGGGVGRHPQRDRGRQLLDRGVGGLLGQPDILQHHRHLRSVRRQAGMAGIGLRRGQPAGADARQQAAREVRRRLGQRRVRRRHQAGRLGAGRRQGRGGRRGGRRGGWRGGRPGGLDSGMRRRRLRTRGCGDAGREPRRAEQLQHRGTAAGQQQERQPEAGEGAGRRAHRLACCGRGGTGAMSPPRPPGFGPCRHRGLVGSGGGRGPVRARRRGSAGRWPLGPGPRSGRPSRSRPSALPAAGSRWRACRGRRPASRAAGSRGSSSPPPAGRCAPARWPGCRPRS